MHWIMFNLIAYQSLMKPLGEKNGGKKKNKNRDNITL